MPRPRQNVSNLILVELQVSNRDCCLSFTSTLVIEDFGPRPRSKALWEVALRKAAVDALHLQPARPL